MAKLGTCKPQCRFYWFLYKKRVKIMYETFDPFLTSKYSQLENFSCFFKTNTLFAKVEFVVNVILEYVSGNPECISFFFPLRFFDFCRFLNLFSFSLIFIEKFQKISVRHGFLLFTTSYI